MLAACGTHVAPAANAPSGIANLANGRPITARQPWGDGQRAGSTRADSSVSLRSETGHVVAARRPGASGRHAHASAGCGPGCRPPRWACGLAEPAYDTADGYSAR